MRERLYYPVSEYYREKYGQKVYKLPVNLPVTCPNKDADGRGCDYCSPLGAGFESFTNNLSFGEQIRRNREFMHRKYKAELFILYLQNFSGTFQPAARLAVQIRSMPMEQIAEIAIATRPDCISRSYAKTLRQLQEELERPITLELGLQTPNYRTLANIHRGHTLAEFLDAVLALRGEGLGVVAHMILDLPGDTMEDAVEGAKILSALGIGGVKLHSLYLAKGSRMAEQYERGELPLPDPQVYIARATEFLAVVRPDMVIHRIAGRIPEEFSAAAGGMSWWKIRDEIEARMRERGYTQGCKCDYLDGKALRQAGFEVQQE